MTLIPAAPTSTTAPAPEISTVIGTVPAFGSAAAAAACCRTAFDVAALESLRTTPFTARCAAERRAALRRARLAISARLMSSSALE